MAARRRKPRVQASLLEPDPRTGFVPRHLRDARLEQGGQVRRQGDWRAERALPRGKQEKGAPQVAAWLPGDAPRPEARPRAAAAVAPPDQDMQRRVRELLDEVPDYL